MINILVDTNILRQEGFESRQMQILARLIKGEKIQLFIPEIVKREFLTQRATEIESELHRICKEIDTFQRTKLFNEEDTDKLGQISTCLKKMTNNTFEVFNESFENWSEKLKISIIDVDPFYIDDILDDYFYGNNAFRKAKETTAALKADGVKHIFIDFHAEATSEKRALMIMLQGDVSGIIGTHTHVGTDDFQISKGTAYLSDMGLTGCRDNVIGMDAQVPIERFMTGLPGRFDVPSSCKKILQMAVMEFESGHCSEAFKIKQFDDGRKILTQAWNEDDGVH